MERKIGAITYSLEKKRVKNINLRVNPNGEIRVSAPYRVSAAEVDRFVLSKADWIESAKKRSKSAVPSAENIPPPEECLALFNEISDRIYPLFKSAVPEKPEIKVKPLKSAWGICHYAQNYITLNTALAAKPIEAVEYVIMHEYAHFIEHDHQRGFHELMKRLMPDYKERKKLLKTNNI